MRTRDERAAGMSVRGRRTRLLAVAAVFVPLLIGTVWGDDDDFPFGPFRMYASTQDPDAPTSWYRLDGIVDGVRVVLPEGSYGMRRAELEAQAWRFARDPDLLGDLAEAYARRNPGAPELDGLDVVRLDQAMRGGRPLGEPVENVVARWRR